jgi:hypothetical protein
MLQTRDGLTPTLSDFIRAHRRNAFIFGAVGLGSLAGANAAQGAVQQTTVSALAADGFEMPDDEATTASVVAAPAYGKEVQLQVTPKNTDPSTYGTDQDDRSVLTVGNTEDKHITQSKFAPANGASVKVLSENAIAASAPQSIALGSDTSGTTLAATAATGGYFWGPYRQQICSQAGCIWWKGVLYSAMYQENNTPWRWWSNPGHYGGTSIPQCSHDTGPGYSMSTNYCNSRNNFSQTGFYNSGNFQVNGGVGLKAWSRSKYIHEHAHTVSTCGTISGQLICPQAEIWVTMGEG